MQTQSPILAWLGPAIGPSAFEVGEEVRAQFVKKKATFSIAFQKTNEGKYKADLYLLCRMTLLSLGVKKIYGGEFCTYNDAQFYSYRRQSKTGRMASLIWID